ncbi:hypothetical protein [Nonomuraea sp. SBT364]|uniref:hypothetical protein n=1 Tax=Nonomuraea sp. SBT364 TaxID=1580530 RepID=UPI00066B6105|nr:hypothetical protein [Nonomuraea sp. SBT364]
MRRIAATLLAAACAGPVFLVSPAATAHTPHTAFTKPPEPKVQAGRPDELDRLRRAMAKFRDPRVAERYGYRPTNTCSEYPYKDASGRRLGGMGYHYVNPTLAGDQDIDLYRPEVLVYVPTERGGRRLGAVEYFKNDRDQLIATADDRPRLLGRQFQGPMEPHEDGMAIHYDLHIWLFKHNPKGPFEPWNTRVMCPARDARH